MLQTSQIPNPLMQNTEDWEESIRYMQSRAFTTPIRLQLYRYQQDYLRDGDAYDRRRRKERERRPMR